MLFFWLFFFLQMRKDFLRFFCISLFFKCFQLLNQFSTPPDKNIGFNTTLFPGGPPPQYWAGSNRVNFGVRMRTGALRLIWSNPSDFIQNCTKCSSDQRIQTEVAGQKTILKHRKKEKNMVFFNKSFFLASQRTYVDNLKIYHLSTCKPVQWWPGPESDKITAQKIKKMVAILCIFFFFFIWRFFFSFADWFCFFRILIDFFTILAFVRFCRIFSAFKTFSAVMSKNNGFNTTLFPGGPSTERR